jgi:hypothetical protein
MSYMVLPDSLLTRFLERYRDYFSTVSLLGQKTMAKFMEPGFRKRHVRTFTLPFIEKSIAGCWCHKQVQN